MDTTENGQKKSPKIFDGAVRIIVLQIAAVAALFVIGLGLKLIDGKLYKQVSGKLLSEINTRTDISQVTDSKAEKSDEKNAESTGVTEIDQQEQSDSGNAEEPPKTDSESKNNDDNKSVDGGTEAEETLTESDTEQAAGETAKSISASYICDLKSDTHNSLIWPVNGTVTSEFGGRSDPINGAASNHGGIDIAVNTGTPVAAALPGIVEKAETNPFYGNYIIINHSKNVKTLYGHCSNLAVKAGQKVSAGETIAYSGSTGRSTGPHLHFEIRIGGKKTDPRLLLPAQKTV